MKTIWLTNTPPSGYKNASGAINYVSNDQFTSLSNTVKYQFLSSYFEVDGIRYVPISTSERTCDAIDVVYDESAANTKIASTVTYKGIQMTVMNIKPYLAYNKIFEDFDGRFRWRTARFCICKVLKHAKCHIGQECLCNKPLCFPRLFVIGSGLNTRHSYCAE